MFSKECLASQQLRNTGMKRFLKEGTITCQEKKSVSLLGSLSHHFFLHVVYSRRISCREMGCVCLLWYPFCLTIKCVTRSGGQGRVLVRECCECSVNPIFPLTVIMKGTALIISRMKGTRNTCSQTLPWKPEAHTRVRKLHCHVDIRGLPPGLMTESCRQKTVLFVRRWMLRDV